MRPRLATGLPFSPWHSGLPGLSVVAGCFLDRTCVHESVGKIQVVQLRRVLLLFALVLGLSALVASLAPSPDTDEEPPAETVAAPPSARAEPVDVSLAGTQRVPLGARLSLEVPVRRPGDVVLHSLGLRQSADPLAPARFELLAEPPGSHPVTLVPLEGQERVLGRLVFADRATVTRRLRGR